MISRGNNRQITLPDSQTVQTTYDGNIVTAIDQVNRKIQRITDGLQKQRRKRIRLHFVGSDRAIPRSPVGAETASGRGQASLR